MNPTEQDILISLEKAISAQQKADLVKPKRKKRGARITKVKKNSIPKSFHIFVFKYKKQILSTSLSFVMLMFTLLSSYVAYAYVVSDETNLVSEIAKHAILPGGETPKVYIVQSEKSEMFDNPYYGNPQIGDNVIVYETSRKVIVYRKAEDKIVNIVNWLN